MLCAVGLGQLVLGVLSAARHAPAGRSGRGGLRWLLVSRPVLVGLPLTVVAMGIAVYQSEQRSARYQEILVEYATSPNVVRGYMWGDRTGSWGRDDSLGATADSAAPAATRIRHYFNCRRHIRQQRPKRDETHPTETTGCDKRCDGQQ